MNGFFYCKSDIQEIAPMDGWDDRAENVEKAEEMGYGKGDL